MRAGVAWAMYEWQDRDKQKALEINVQGKAEKRRLQNPDGNLPDLESPEGCADAQRSADKQGDDRSG